MSGVRASGIRTLILGNLPTIPDLSQPQTAATDSVPVNVDNFIRAEADMDVIALAKQGGGGPDKLLHRREPAPGGYARPQTHGALELAIRST